jgi:iron(III) transport system substrate-binding protein
LFVLILQSAAGALFLLAATWVVRRPDRLTRWVTLVLATALVLLAPLRWDPVGQIPRTLRVLAVMDVDTTDALVEAFELRTGIRCQVDPFQGGARESAELILEGRIQPDLMIGGTSEIHDLLASAEVSVPFVLPEDEGRIDRFDPTSHRFTPIYVGYLAVVYRPITDFTAKPPDWAALIDPRWVDRVSLPSPTSTSGGVVFLATQLLRQPDPERGWQYIQILVDGGARWEPRSSDVITRVASGRSDLGVSWAHDAWRRRERDRLPIEVLIPIRTGYEVGAASVLRWARDMPAAEEFIRFLTSREAQEIQAEVGLRVPLRTDVGVPGYLDPQRPAPGDRGLAFYDRAVVLREQSEWISRWKSEVGDGR